MSYTIYLSIRNTRIIISYSNLVDKKGVHPFDLVEFFFNIGSTPEEFFRDY